MNGRPAAFNAAIGALGATASGDSPGGFLMLDSRAGTAWLRMESACGEPRTARVSRWLAVVRVGRGAGQVPATRVIWLVDVDSAAWPGGQAPAGLAASQERHDRNLAGQGAEERLVLWFHARAALRRARAPWAFTAVGVLGAAGIVDGARARVSRWPFGARLRLRATIDAGDWGLSGVSLFDANGEPLYLARLTIAAAGRPRELDLTALRQWL
jgi:hypothetical protein